MIKLVHGAGGGAVVALLLLIITAVGIAFDQPGYGIAFYAVIPIVLAAFLFGHFFWGGGGLVTAGVATVVYLTTELITRPGALSGEGLWIAAVNRSPIYFLVAVVVTVLLGRERRLRSQVQQQKHHLMSWSRYAGRSRQRRSRSSRGWR